MRKVLLLAITLLALAACKKDKATERPITDPPFPTLIAQETITQGTFWDFNIGDAPATIYQKIQQTGPTPGISYMGVVSNSFTRLEDIETKILLYKDLILRDPQAAEYAIIHFDNNKVTGISTTTKARDSWPGLLAGNNNIVKGDAIGNVYQKLLAIRDNNNFTRFFQAISMASKDVAKEYEAGMAASPKWQLYAADTDKRFWYVDLNFSGGNLTSVSYQLVQYHD